MKLASEALVDIIHRGDLKALQLLLEGFTDTHVKELLSVHCDVSAYLRRPSNGKEVVIQRPSLLMVAVSEWYTDVVEFICGSGIDLEQEASVQDITNTPVSYSGVTALHLAALGGKLSMVRTLIENGANVNAQTSLGDTPLFEACFEGHVSIVQYLLAHGADPETSNNRKTTCLMIAAYADNAEVIECLINTGVNLDRKDKDGRNVLFYSAANGRPDSLGFLIGNGAKVQNDTHGVNILMEATKQRQLDIIKYLLEDRAEPPVSPNATDDSGLNVLFYTTEHKKPDILEYLVHYGIPFQASSDGRTLLMTATMNSNRPIVMYLVENADEIAYDVHAKDDRGRNALFYAISGSEQDMLEYLLDHGIRPETSADGITVLMQSVAKHRYDLARYLLTNLEQFSMDIHALDKDGWNTLMYSAAGGHLDIFDLLVMYGAQCQPAADGRTILMQAATIGDVEFIKRILDDGSTLQVYTNARDNDGWNALFYTVQGSHIEAFKFLVKRGAKICTTVNGTTPLMEAADKGKREMVEYLTKMAATLDLDLNHRDRDGANVLFYCVAGGHLNLLKFLLNAGCDVTEDDHGRNLLMQAALSGHMSVVQFLVNQANQLNLDIHHQDKNGRNVLFYCIEGDHLNILEHLLSTGVVPCVDKNGRTVLMQASRVGSLRIVQYLLKLQSTLVGDFNHKDINGENAIFYAVRSENLQIVNLLLEKDIELSSNNFGVNVLSQCMSDGRDEIVDAILKSDINLSKAMGGVDTKGRSIFHHSVTKGDVDMLERLGQYYDSSIDGDHDGVTVLMRACQQTDLSIIKYLVEVMKVDYHKTDLRNRTALFYAIESSNFPAVDFLLSLFTTVESDDEGKSVLVYTVISGDIKLTRFLLRSKFGKSLMNALDRQNRTVCHYAAQLGREAILTLLHKHGCQPNLADVAGCTPLMCACTNSHAGSASLLLRHGAAIDDLDNHHRCALHYCFDNPPSLKCVKVLVSFDADPNEPDDAGVTPLMLACGSCTQTNIPVISNLLEHGGEPVYQDNEGRDAYDYCPFDAEYVKAMLRRKGELEDVQKQALASFQTRLTSDIEMNSVLRGLLKEKAFTKTLNFEVMKRPQSERVARLLEILRTRGQLGFRAFCRVLKKECELELAYGLQKAAYKKDKEVFV